MNRDYEGMAEVIKKTQANYAITFPRTFFQRLGDTILGRRWYVTEVELGDGLLRRTIYVGRNGVVTEISHEEVPSKRI
jgi:hypothetical protein